MVFVYTYITKAAISPIIAVNKKLNILECEIDHFLLNGNNECIQIITCEKNWLIPHFHR